MPEGKLEVLLVSAHGLKDKDVFSSNDPYCLVGYDDQERKSCVKKGTNPEWNETFNFEIKDGVYEIKIKLMDEDTLNDDYLGEATISLEGVLQEGSVPPASYEIIKDGKSRGELKVGLNFFSDEPRELDETDFRRGEVMVIETDSEIVRIERVDDDDD